MTLNSSRSAIISIFGLGKLGAVIAGCYANRGFQVIGVDVNHQCVENCRLGVPPVQEPGINALYTSGQERLMATTDGLGAVLRSQVTLIAVPTPSEADGGYSLKYVLEACAVIAGGLRQKNAYHLVVLKSTVLPGACDEQIIPFLETRSGKRSGQDFGFCYNPEFIALGSVIQNILNPDLTLIGESDPLAGNHLLEILDHVIDTRAPTARMNFANAELAKLAVNTFVTMKISFANLLTAVCEKLPGGNIDQVTSALGQDSRIGPKYIKGGLGFGGPCFPRDNAALLSLSRRLGVSFPLAAATDEANREIPTRIVDLIGSMMPAEARVAVLGLSYKPDTPVIEESQAVQIAAILAKRGFDVVAYDPLAIDAAKKVLGSSIRFASSPQDCVREADLVLIATPWKQFRDLDYGALATSRSSIIVDCWGLVDEKKAQGASIIRLGTNMIHYEKNQSENHVEL